MEINVLYRVQDVLVYAEYTLGNKEIFLKSQNKF